MHHEQAAAFAADAVGADRPACPGVAMATSGPGATNLLTGIGSCYFDSSPAVFITGQVNRDEQKGDRPIRQLGFQETDIVSMAAPITKAAWQVETPEELPGAARARLRTGASSGRPGPGPARHPDGRPAARRSTGPRRPRTPSPPPPAGRRRRVAASCSTRCATRRAPADPRRRRRPRRRAPAPVLRACSTTLGVPVVNSLHGGRRRCRTTHPLRVGMIGTLRQPLGEPGDRAAPTCCSSSAAGSTSARPAPTPTASGAAGRSSTSTASRAR